MRLNRLRLGAMIRTIRNEKLSKENRGGKLPKLQCAVHRAHSITRLVYALTFTKSTNKYEAHADKVKIIS